MNFLVNLQVFLDLYAETIPFPMTELPLKFKCANVLNPFSMKQAISELAYVFKFSVL